MAKKFSGISVILAKMTILPIILLGVFTTFFGINRIIKTMGSEICTTLSSYANIAVMELNEYYPGDMNKYSKANQIFITKGDTYLNEKHQFLDSLKQETNVDYTIFYDDLRIITTLTNDKGERIVGTTANSRIINDVIKANSTAFYRNVDIFGTRYYCFYKPIYNSDDSCVGMVGITMPADRVQIEASRAMLPYLAFTIIAIFLSFLWSRHYSNSFKQALSSLENALDQTSNGKLSNTVPSTLLARDDEFGKMARSIIEMQTSLRSLVEQDALTGLSNRRFGQARLNQMFSNTKASHQHFSIALGDIDFFKNFNDTYGHDCGDYVLINIARVLHQSIKEYGFCARWGGEEFLIVFVRGDYETHKLLMQELVTNISKHSLVYNELSLSVTMTFGLLDVYEFDSCDDAIIEVDRLLYYGKENGRNRLVTTEDAL